MGMETATCPLQSYLSSMTMFLMQYFLQPFAMPKRDRRLPLLAAEEYAEEVAVGEDERAKRNGTFGVGELLVGDKGKILKSIANSVIKNRDKKLMKHLLLLE